MLVIGFDEQQIKQAAQDVGVQLLDLRAEGRTRAGLPKFRFRLALAGERWRRIGHTGRRVAAVCWHGHKAFFTRLFALNPDGIVRTSMVEYNGQQEFDRKYAETGDRNIGSLYQPLLYKHACECGR